MGNAESSPVPAEKLQFQAKTWQAAEQANAASAADAAKRESLKAAEAAKNAAAAAATAARLQAARESARSVTAAAAARRAAEEASSRHASSTGRPEDLWASWFPDFMQINEEKSTLLPQQEKMVAHERSATKAKAKKKRAARSHSAPPTPDKATVEKKEEEAVQPRGLQTPPRRTISTRPSGSKNRSASLVPAQGTKGGAEKHTERGTTAEAAAAAAAAAAAEGSAAAGAGGKRPTPDKKQAAAAAKAAESKRLRSLEEGDEENQRHEDNSEIDYGIFGNIFGAYDGLVMAIVRPPRHEYSIAELGPSNFNFCGLNVHRQDLQLTNARGQKLECSHWQPDSRSTSRFRRASTGSSNTKPRPCIVFLHGNSSSRVAAVGNLSFALSLDYSVFAFDFSGSGRSEGDFVTLGFNEQHDLKVVVDYLRSARSVSSVVLWGRSMGAATALLYEPSADSKFVRALIVDSSFSSVSQLFDDFTARATGFGSLLTGGLKFMIRSSVIARAGFDPDDVRPIDNAVNARIPAFFIAGRQDAFIIPERHTFPLHRAYKVSKQIHIVQGDHNALRPEGLNYIIHRFVAKNAPKGTLSSRLQGSERFWGSVPWSHPSFSGSSTTVRVTRGDGLAAAATHQSHTINKSLSSLQGGAAKSSITTPSRARNPQLPQPPTTPAPTPPPAQKVTPKPTRPTSANKQNSVVGTPPRPQQAPSSTPSSSGL